jgi:hypothetical protein
MINHQVQNASEAAALIDVDVLALVAKANQLEEMASSKSAFASYWAGSASASVGHHYAKNAIINV